MPRRKAEPEKPQEFRFIEITNWEKYQNAKPGAPWVKDYVEKDSDRAYCKLTALQRYVFDGLCRLRQRFSRRLDNESTWVSTALCMVSTDRPHVRHALDTLCTSGLLTFTNQQLEKESRGEESKRRGDFTTIHDELDSSSKTTPLPSGGEAKTKLTVDTDSPEDFAEIWQRLMLLNPMWKPEKKADRWGDLLVKDFKEILAQREAWQLHEILAYSQFGLKQAEFNYTTASLKGKGGTIAEERKARCRKKNDGTWEKILARYEAVLADEPLPAAPVATKKPAQSETPQHAAPPADGFIWLNQMTGRVKCTRCDDEMFREKMDDHDERVHPDED